MGYSARYHAISLAAVFLALAIGILIGVGFGEDVVSDTKQSLRDSLRSNLEDTRGRADERAAELADERNFSEQIYPTLVRGALEGQRIALIALGSPPVDVSDDVEAALEPTGAELGEVAVVRIPPELEELSELLPRSAFDRSRRRPGSLIGLGRRGGRALVLGGAVFDRVSDELLSAFSGDPGGIDAVIVDRDRPDDLNERESRAAERLEGGIIEGMTDAGVPVIGVETSDAEGEDSSIGFFQDRGISTVDSVDLVSGRVAMVLALAGAKGSFGINEERLLPELLQPRASRAREPRLAVP